MKGYVQDIERVADKSEAFRRVLYTAKNCQLLVMALEPKGEIGMEVHKLDQFSRVEEGAGCDAASRSDRLESIRFAPHRIASRAATT